MLNTENQAVITWVWEDIQSLRPNWTQQQCEDFIWNYKRPIEERSIEAGWDVIRELISVFEYDQKNKGTVG